MRLVSTFLNILLAFGMYGAVQGVHHGQMQTALIENGRKIAAALQTSPSFLHINDDLGMSNCEMNLFMRFFALFLVYAIH
jgi:Ca2+/Na+ antiporter